MNYAELVLSQPDIEAIGQEPYEPRGIFNSEMALVIALCRHLNIEVVIESGRARGQSTYLLAKYLPDTEIISFERWRDDDALFCEARLSPYDNAKLRYGDGLTYIPSCVEANKGKRIAMLLDGPKGMPALGLVEKVSEHLTAAFVHDMRKLDHGFPALFRMKAEERGWFFTDDEAYVNATKHLDDPVIAIGTDSDWQPGFINGLATGSYGPTLGVLINNQRNQNA